MKFSKRIFSITNYSNMLSHEEEQKLRDEDTMYHTYHLIMRMIHHDNLYDRLEQLDITKDGELERVVFNSSINVDEFRRNYNKFIRNVFYFFDKLTDMCYPDRMYISIVKTADGTEEMEEELVIERYRDEPSNKEIESFTFNDD
jgi:hypothetical protein